MSDFIRKIYEEERDNIPDILLRRENDIKQLSYKISKIKYKIELDINNKDKVINESGKKMEKDDILEIYAGILNKLKTYKEKIENAIKYLNETLNNIQPEEGKNYEQIKKYIKEYVKDLEQEKEWTDEEVKKQRQKRAKDLYKDTFYGEINGGGSGSGSNIWNYILTCLLVIIIAVLISYMIYIIKRDQKRNCYMMSQNMLYNKI